MNKNESIFHSLSLIEEMILEKISIEYLANDIHFSKYHYQRLFREVVGDSVMHYVTRRKISLAAKELVTTKATILEIALKYGYETHEGFTRSFETIMGVPPMKYRKYRLLSYTPKIKKGEFYMTYSKTIENIVKELNTFLLQLKETTEYTKNQNIIIQETNTFYEEFWDCIANRMECIANHLQTTLYHIIEESQYFDKISTYFLLIKTIEDISFQSFILSFQIGLTISRAKPQHRELFKPICDQYTLLAKNAEIKTDKVIELFQELTMLIFSDIKTNAKQLIQNMIEKGISASSILTSDCNYPYSYIAEQISKITNELSSLPLNSITLSMLEDYKLQIDIVSFTFDIDVMRTPSHKDLIYTIASFQESIQETIEFFQTLSADFFQTSIEQDNSSSHSNLCTKKYTKLTFKLNYLLFYLKGEFQKLGNLHLTETQKEQGNHICHNLTLIIESLKNEITEEDFDNIKENLKIIHKELLKQANELGIYGNALQYIAQEI